LHLPPFRICHRFDSPTDNRWEVAVAGGLENARRATNLVLPTSASEPLQSLNMSSGGRRGVWHHLTTSDEEELVTTSGDMTTGDEATKQ
jgi:hypothetical protein